MKTVIQHISSELGRVERLKASVENGSRPADMEPTPKSVLDDLNDFVKRCLPSGSGIDVGCALSSTSNPDTSVVIDVPYHHMDENGYYCGWATYRVIAKASLAHGFDITVRVKDRGGQDAYTIKTTKEYLGELFHHVLGLEVVWNADREEWDVKKDVK